MQFSKLCIVSLAMIVTSSTATMAQEAVDWTGFYAGVFGGYASGTSDLTISPLAGLPGAPVTESGDISGLFGGVTLGVNYQLQQGFVVGAEADIGVADIVGASAGAAFIPLTAEVSTLASVRGRVGFAVDRFLPFATAGLAVGHIRQGIDLGGGATFDLANETVLGWTVGAGVEYAVTDAISVKTEYRYSQYDGKDSSFFGLLGATSNVSFGTHDLRLGVNYRF